MASDDDKTDRPAQDIDAETALASVQDEVASADMAENLDDLTDIIEQSAHPAGPIALLKDSIEILSNKPLKALDRGAVKAFVARPKGQNQDVYYALICEKHLVPRRRIAEKFSTILTPSLTKLISYGVVYWPPAKAERFVFIYEQPTGAALITSLEDMPGLDWRHERAMAIFVKPLANVLLDMRDVDFVHGCINPANIFYTGNQETDRVQLGECLSAPPGYHQPALFEPIERAMTDPIARGIGTTQDDLYAFGVSLTMILRSKDPLKGMSEEKIIRQKIEHGSYVALTGKDRFTGAILELLRGLLYDDRQQRWDLDDVFTWLDGQRLSPKQSSQKPKAARPLLFNDGRYVRSSLLAMDMHKNASEALQMIDNGTLEQWVDRSLEDKLTKNRLEKALEEARQSGRGPGYVDRVLNQVSMALDPTAPIRFKGLRMLPDGVAYTLVETVNFQKDIVPFIELINQHIVYAWLNHQVSTTVDVNTLISKFDSCRAFLRQTNMGYGIERCVYFLMQESPCLSPHLADYYVTTPEQLLLALNDIGTKKKRPDMLFDRHSTAFLSVHDKRSIDPFLTELNSSQYYKKILANVKIVASVQKKSKMGLLPHLGQWVSDILGPVYGRLHDRDLRKSLKDKVDVHAKKGDILKIMTLLDRNDTWQKDFTMFKKAMTEYFYLNKEQDILEEKMQTPKKFGREIGREVSAVISGVLAGLLIIAFTFMHFSDIQIF
jgi:hypothetical protein